MYFGMSLCAHAFGKLRFSVDKQTCCPTFNHGSSGWCRAFAWCVCLTQLLIIALCALMMRFLTFSVKSCTLANSDSPMVWIVFGMYPYVSSKGVKPVDWLMLEFKANSTIGRCFGQSSWSGLTIAHSTCETFRSILSDAPFVCGWKAVDLASLIPSRQCVSVQNCDVNLGSLSLTIVSGSPCSRTICDMNIGASCATVVVVCSGIRCTSDINQHSTTTMWR